MTEPEKFNFGIKKFITVRNKDEQVFTLIFNGLYRHKYIFDSLSDCELQAAGFTCVSDDGTLEPSGFSSSLKVGSRDAYPIRNDDFKYSGCFLNFGDVSVITDNLNALDEALDSSIQEFSIVIKPNSSASVITENKALHNNAVYSLTRML